MVIVHNHPSGDPDPSPEDIAITQRLRECAELLGVRLCDHVIVGSDRYYSFSDRGLLDGCVGTGDSVLLRPEKTNGEVKPPERTFRKDKGKARLKDYKPRKDKGIPRGPRNAPLAAVAALPS